MSGMKKIGFFGAYCYDIILYLARTLCLSGKQVLVIDRSTEQEIIRTIRSVNEGDLQLGIFRFCGIDVTEMENANAAILEKELKALGLIA